MNTKEKIIHTSRDFFAGYGYEETSLAMIADSVGIKKPSLYAHFKSKEDIFTAVMDKELFEYSASVKEILSDTEKNVKTLLYDMLLRFSLYDDEASSEFYYRYSRYQPAGLEAMIIEKFQENEKVMLDMFNTVLSRGKENGEFDAALSNQQIYDTYFLLMDGLSSTPVMYKEEYKRDGVNHIWEIFERGVSPRN